jgi:arylesterase / paraoxonase
LVCRKYLPNAPGTEDFVYSPKHKLVFVSSYERREKPKFGSIQIIKTDLSLSRRLLLEEYPHEGFEPLGITIYETREKTLIYVINHFGSKSIDIFEYKEEKQSLKFIKSIKNELFISPNSLILVNQEEFYVSNDHNTSNDLFKILIDFFYLQYSSVVHYKNGVVKYVVNENLRYANGLEISPDKKKLYVGSTTGFSVHVYDRNMENGDLKIDKVIQLDFGVDNLKLMNGQLYVTGHPYY